MASFPAALWARFTARTNATPNTNNQPNDHNAMADEIVAIETELGLDPAGAFTDVASRLDGIEHPAFNVQTSLSYTLALSDLGKMISMVNASAQTLTVPPDSSVNFAIGTQIPVRQGGAGQITFSPGAGVTLRSRGSVFRTAGIYAYATLIKIAANTWDVTGDIVA